jgi:hypothetical protein
MKYFCPKKEVFMATSASSAELLKSAGLLNRRDFDQFVHNILALRAQRHRVGLEPREAALLKKINQHSLSTSQLERLADLAERGAVHQLTPDEHEEYLSLIEQSEQFDAERAECLAELAHIRRVPVRTIMEQLGLISPHHA